MVQRNVIGKIFDPRLGFNESYEGVLIMVRLFGLLLLIFSTTANPLLAQESDGEEETPAPLQERFVGELMTVDRLEAIIRVLAPEAERANNAIVFSYTLESTGDIPITIVTDPAADRMRIVIGIARESEISSERMKRLMQANYDSALDARYALGNGVLWATFIHPLSSLSDEDFLSGLSQTINIVVTFGTTYTSGAFVFGGGDSQGILEDLLEEFRKKTEPEV